MSRITREEQDERDGFRGEVEQVVLSIIARAANHETFREHQGPLRRPRSCVSCEIALMLENMHRAMQRNQEPASCECVMDAAAPRGIDSSACSFHTPTSPMVSRAARGSTEGPQPGQDNAK